MKILQKLWRMLANRNTGPMQRAPLSSAANFNEESPNESNCKRILEALNWLSMY